MRIRQSIDDRWCEGVMASNEFYVLMVINAATFIYCARRFSQLGRELSNDLHQVRKELVHQRVEQLKEVGEREKAWNEFKVVTAKEIAKLGEIYSDAKMAEQLRQVSSRISHLEHAIFEALTGPRSPQPVEGLPDAVSGRPTPLQAKSTITPAQDETAGSGAPQSPQQPTEKTEPASIRQAN